MMNFDEYQKLANRTGNNTDIFVSFLGLAGEAGECCDLYKKVYGHGHKLDLEKFKKEIGDVIWYCSDLCTKLGLSLDEVAQLNIDKLKARYPNGFDPQRSQNRKPEDV